MKRKFSKILSALLAAALVLSCAACGSTENAPESSGVKTPDHSQTLTLECFTSASFQGMQPGFFAKLVKDKFNIELNIISTTVTGNGDSLYQTRAAAGDLGDLVILPKAKAKDCMETGLIMDITDYYNNSKYLKDFDLAVQEAEAYLGTDKVYGIPTNCMTQSTVTPMFEFNAPYNGGFLRLDYYNELGAPEIKSTDALLDVLKQMQEKHPETDSGKKTYGFSLFKDWDGSYMNLAAQMSWIYGYDNGLGFMFTNADATDVQDVAADGGVYYKALEMYYKANQMGLVDPDSASQNWDSVWSKAVEGQNLFAWWSFLASGFNSPENKNNGKFMCYIPVGEDKLLGKGSNTYGDSDLMSVGSGAESPERVFELIDWLASEEAPYYSASANAGPQGCVWDLDENGKPYLTDLGYQALSDPTLILPEEYGGGKFEDGESKLPVIRSPFSINTQTGESFVSQTWESFKEKNHTKADELYEEIFGAENAEEYLTENSLLDVAPSTSFAMPVEDSELANKRAQCSDIIKEASWKLVFAESEDAFNALWAEMKTQLGGFGYEDVIKADKGYVEQLKAARAESVKNAQ